MNFNLIWKTNNLLRHKDINNILVIEDEGWIWFRREEENNSISAIINTCKLTSTAYYMFFQMNWDVLVFVMYVLQRTQLIYLCACYLFPMSTIFFWGCVAVVLSIFICVQFVFKRYYFITHFLKIYYWCFKSLYNFTLYVMYTITKKNAI